MKKQQLTALGLLVAVAAWMFFPRGTGSSTADVSETPPREILALPEGAPASESPDTILVRAARLSPQTYVERVRVRGRTQAFRHVEVRAEEAGRIVSEPVPRGARVRAGDVLCEIAVDNRDAGLREAAARREQAQLEYEAALDLRRRDLQSDVAVAQMKAALESAAAAVHRAELALEKTRIVAPFDGVVERRVMELGDLLNVGTVCASVLDDTPMLLVGLVPEQDVGSIGAGARVRARLLSGDAVAGVVTHLARAADPASRSYRIEVTVDNADGAIREGITAELLVDAAETRAHLIPASALTLDDGGDIGVKLIDGDGRVHFRRVEIIGDNTGQINPGIWVSGLEGTVDLITVGQEIVFPGQVVASRLVRPE